LIKGNAKFRIERQVLALCGATSCAIRRSPAG
jgi:hypothetical protein